MSPPISSPVSTQALEMSKFSVLAIVSGRDALPDQLVAQLVRVRREQHQGGQAGEPMA
jgi:hypothetical protein